MAKTTNPLNSETASGSIDSTLTFSSNKGRAYVKLHAKPKQPDTSAQRTARMALAFASKVAAGWPSLIEANFGAEAQRKGTTAAAEYIAECAPRLKTWQGVTPAKTPINGSPGVGGLFLTGTAGPRSILWTWTIGNPPPNYAWALVVSTIQAETLLFAKTIFVSTNVQSYRQTGLTPGVPWYGRIFLMREAGSFRRSTSNSTATPTA